jgi:hypothetical protein
VIQSLTVGFAYVVLSRDVLQQNLSLNALRRNIELESGTKLDIGWVIGMA